MTYKLCIPCLFGLEGLVADELRQMGYRSVNSENGRVLFQGDEGDIATVNIGLRTGERLLLLLGEFSALSFDDLFEGVKALPWDEILPKDAAFPVKGHCLNSKLHSVPDCQKIIKKATADKLSEKYGLQRLPETGATYQIRFAIFKDMASIYLDTSGAGLHKRGYRPNASLAPLRETLAAAIVKISRYKGRDNFVDPFCGSGTIAIEAALTALNRAPGRNRRFSAEEWALIPKTVWDTVRKEAEAQEYTGDYQIFGSDIDPSAIAIARENAKRAGVEQYIRFQVSDMKDISLPEGRGILAANPPYGERILDIREAEVLYKQMGKSFGSVKDLNLYVLSSNPDFEKHFGRPASKRRKLYNGMIQCQLYMYF
ncbi:MAG: class I SAM-dependent RNA methyltransferase [Clostridiales bacterium]|nr:class I SAM-dependent RNA methyltransferase [Clostridiales bacterium]